MLALYNVDIVNRKQYYKENNHGNYHHNNRNDSSYRTSRIKCLFLCDKWLSTYWQMTITMYNKDITTKDKENVMSKSTPVEWIAFGSMSPLRIYSSFVPLSFPPYTFTMSYLWRKRRIWILRLASCYLNIKLIAI